MEKLPILRADFPEFDWGTAGELATAEEKARAYVAATTKGQCADFHRYVWNEMIVILADAFEEAGIAWNDSYATYIQTFVLLQYDDLTAKKFNSFRLNLDSIAPTGWKWAFQKDIIGYTGRKDFYGVTEKGSSADILYGWYMIEIARKLNLTLRIMKNTADFGEFISILQSISSIDADAAALPSAPITVYHSAKSNTSMNGIALPSATIAVYHSALSDTDTLLYPAPSHLLDAVAIANTQNKAVVESKETKRLSSRRNVRTMFAAAMSRWMVIGVGAFANDKTKHKVDLDFWSALHVEGKAFSQSIYDAAVHKAESFCISAEDMAKSRLFADAVRLPSMPLPFAREDSDSFYTAQVIYLPSFGVSANEESFSLYKKPTLDTPMPAYVEGVHLSDSDHVAEMAKPFVFCIDYTENKSVSVSDGVVRAVPSFSIKAKEQSESRYISSAVAREIFPVGGKDISSSFPNAEINKAESEPLRASEVSTTISSAEGQTLLTKRISVRETAESGTLAKIDTAWIPPQKITAGIYFISQVYDYHFDSETGILEVI